MKKIFKRLFIFLIVVLHIVLSLNLMIINGTRMHILSLNDIKEDSQYDCILILGAGIENDKPSKMLQERLDTGIDVYNRLTGNKILMSGDHTRKEHDEVNIMKYYAFLHNVPTSDIFMDHAGVSTFDSLLRARDIFGAKKVLIVTQKYHLYRSLYIANALGLEAEGISATKENYFGQSKREVREVLARIKDAVKAKVNLVPVYNEQKISLKGNGDRTNDKSLTIVDTEGRKRYLKKNDSYFQFKRIIENNVMKEESCSATPTYTIYYDQDRPFQIEIAGETIHIRENNREVKLNLEESKIMMELILNTGIV